MGQAQHLNKARHPSRRIYEVPKGTRSLSGFRTHSFPGPGLACGHAFNDSAISPQHFQYSTYTTPAGLDNEFVLDDSRVVHLA
jgi:hypothetical protein